MTEDQACSTANKKELLRDLQRAAEFDQSALFKKIYEEEFGVFGGAPFGSIIGDYEFGKGPEDIELLEKVAQVAAAAHAPFVSAAASEFFNIDSYTNLDAPRDLGKVFDTTEYAKWKSFRANEDSRYVALTAAAGADAPALRQGHQAGGCLRVRGRGGRQRPLQVSVGQRGLGAGGAAYQRLLAPTAGARRFAGWKAADWWRACRCTTSTPTKATSR